MWSPKKQKTADEVRVSNVNQPVVTELVGGGTLVEGGGKGRIFEFGGTMPFDGRVRDRQMGPMKRQLHAINDTDVRAAIASKDKDAVLEQLRQLSAQKVTWRTKRSVKTDCASAVEILEQVPPLERLFGMMPPELVHTRVSPLQWLIEPLQYTHQ